MCILANFHSSIYSCFCSLFIWQFLISLFYSTRIYLTAFVFGLIFSVFRHFSCCLSYVLFHCSSIQQKGILKKLKRPQQKGRHQSKMEEKHDRYRAYYVHRICELSSTKNIQIRISGRISESDRWRTVTSFNGGKFYYSW